jgi:hypothetical protein
MFRSIGRTILKLPVHVIVLLASLPVFVYVDAWHVVQNPFFVDVTHVALLAFATLCLIALFADGSAPAGTRTRPASFITLALALMFLLIALAADFIEPALPKTIIGTEEYPNGGHASWSYPDFQSASDIAAFAGNAILTLATLATLVLGICGPACAALFGARRAIPESWRAFRRNYWRIGIGAVVSVFILAPVMILLVPLTAYWDALGFASEPQNLEMQAKFQLAWEICNQIGPRSIAQSGAAAAFLFGAYLWGVGRLVARLLTKQSGAC